MIIEILPSLLALWFLIILPGEIHWHIKNRARKKNRAEINKLLIQLGESPIYRSRARSVTPNAK